MEVKLCVHPSDLAPGLMLGHEVQLGSDLELGGGVVIHSGTVIGDGCEIQDGAVLGKRPRLGRRSTASGPAPEPLVVEAHAAICTGAVVYAGVRVGERAIIGDQAQVRERAVIGSDTVVGRGTGVEAGVTIGADVRIQSNCYLAAGTFVEDRVFIAPGVVTTNDHSMGRHAPDAELVAATLRRACRVGAGSVLTPGVEIGEEAFVAAGAVVCESVSPRAVVMGVPARPVRDVPLEDLWERWQ
jgi:acetyltransferase-like isoleucine patch superfamily enzyme